VIEGGSVYLRALERDDVARMHAWFNDPEVRSFLDAYYPISLDAEAAWYESLQRPGSKDRVYGIVERESGTHIGNVGLHNIDWPSSAAEVGIVIGDKRYWSKGLGTEAMVAILRFAFATMNLRRIYLKVYAYNTRAIRSYEKAGFVREAMLRDDVYSEGSYHDTIVMGMLREEFFNTAQD
jgi:RimJ/RimL family protein N-acetyltransferase